MGRQFGARGKQGRGGASASSGGTHQKGAQRGAASAAGKGNHPAIPRDKVEVRILRWAHGGEGIAIPTAGPWVGRVTFVPGAVPGDRVVVEATEIHERWVRARIVSVSGPSPERRLAPCEVQGLCGGCPWMEGSEVAQAESRRAILEGELKKRLGRSDVPVTLRETPRAFGYRQRLRLRIHAGQLGYHGRQSHDFVAVTTCPIAVPMIREAMIDVQKAVTGIASGRATMLAGAEGVATWVEADGRAPFRVGKDRVTVQFGDVAQSLAPEAFAQANAEVVAQVLADITALAEAVRPTTSPAHAAELFAGSGTLTTALWKAGYTVDAWEVAETARPAFDATRTALGLPPDAGIWAACDLLVTGFPTPPPRRAPDLVLLDPPRVGAFPMVPWLRRSGARRILYLACDLAAGLRDVAALTTAAPNGEAPAWRLTETIAYDMFPHSGHQEVLFVLDPA